MGVESFNSPDLRCCVFSTSCDNDSVRIAFFIIFGENLNSCNYSTKWDETVVWENTAGKLTKETK